MGRLISDKMSYRNHYMCSGEATSIDYRYINLLDWIILGVVTSIRARMFVVSVVRGSHNDLKKDVKLSESII